MRVLALFLLCAAPCYALPDAPVAKPITNQHRFMDRFAKIELIAGLSLASADMAQTCYHLANGWREVNLPTQSCAGAIGINVGAYAAGEGLSYLLHRTGHHKLERLPILYLGYGNAKELAFSMRKHR